jgi:hypothetical protein
VSVTFHAFEVVLSNLDRRRRDAPAERSKEPVQGSRRRGAGMHRLPPVQGRTGGAWTHLLSSPRVPLR